MNQKPVPEKHGITSQPKLYEQIVNDPTTFFESLLQAIDNAKLSIDMEYYIFEKDYLGLKFINALFSAANRGVNIRIIVDGVGSANSIFKIIDKLSHQNISLKIYHPLPWQIQLYPYAISEGSFREKLFRFITRVNKRDHRKLCIIDKETLWTGSFNITSDHLGKVNNDYSTNSRAQSDSWRDYGIICKGNYINDINRDYETLWRNTPKRFSEHLFKRTWNILSLKSRLHRNELLLKLIDQSTVHIWITSAYFSPSSKILKAIKAAAKRGVDVKIIVPIKSDVLFFPLLTSTYYSDLLRSGVNIFEYRYGILHAKALIIDDTYILGSTNLNHRSYLHDLELDLIVHTAKAKQDLRLSFEQDLLKSHQISWRSPLQKGLSWLGWIPRLLRYWL